MTIHNHKAVFDTVRAIKGAALSQADVDALNAVLAGQVPTHNPAPGPVARRINAAGLALIKSFEGSKLTAYKCPADVWTIGYGSTGSHVTPGKRITEAEAETLLLDDLERFEADVAKAAPRATDGQFAAMVALAFNVGLSAFGGSTLLKLHNAGDYAGAAAQFGRWDKAGGRVLAGLTRRRLAERMLYEGKVA